MTKIFEIWHYGFVVGYIFSYERALEYVKNEFIKENNQEAIFKVNEALENYKNTRETANFCAGLYRVIERREMGCQL